MAQKMIVNARLPEEIRIALVEDGELEELFIERTTNDNYVGNVYKGVVVNTEQNLQAAFVDIGIGRNGFLHVSDVEPHYFKQAVDFTPHDDSNRYRSDHSRPRPPIQQIFQRGDEVLVQVSKEAVGTKGPTLTTYLGIPGRYLVLMPHLARVGVSRKIEDEALRRRLRKLLEELNPPEELGFIIRTAGSERKRSELARDLAYLMRLWRSIVRRLKNIPGPVGVYEESDVMIRTIRDSFTDAVDQIIVDEEGAFERAKEFMDSFMPRYADRIEFYNDPEPLFSKYGLDEEIAKISQRAVPLRDGGSIVIDQAEALVAIDVNSGNFHSNSSPEENAFQLNLRAAKEIARQIRLRDLGGVIVNDFIDMNSEQHRRAVERTLRDAVKRDRAKTRILRTSPFGLIEMTRQRTRPGLSRTGYRECPCCRGGGAIKTFDSMLIDVLRYAALAMQNPRARKVVALVSEEVADFINNQRRDQLSELEEHSDASVIVKSVPDAWPETLEFEVYDAKGKKLPFDSGPPRYPRR